MKSLLALLLLTVPTHAQLSNIPKWEQLDPSGSSTTLRKGGRSYIHRLQFSRPTPATTAAQRRPQAPHLKSKFLAVLCDLPMRSIIILELRNGNDPMGALAPSPHG